MSKKAKKDEMNDEILNVENLDEVSEAPVEEKKASKKKGGKGSAGLTVVKAILYVLTFPVMILLSFLICYQAGSQAPYYSFWPYVPVILVGIFALIFLIVGLIVYRKKSKRSVMQKTVSLLLCCVILTGGFGVLMDVVFPDVISMATSSTLYVEDVYNDYDEQMDYNISLVRQFIRLNLLNGNYDGKYAYSTLAAKSGAAYSNETVAAEMAKYQNDLGYDSSLVDAKYASYNDLDKEMYDFVYNDYVLLDYKYAFAIGGERRALAASITTAVSSTYKTLCNEGVKTSGLGAIATKGNEKMSWLFNQNYAAMNQDGYLSFDDDCGLGYATSNRMTIPIVVRIILNDDYDATQPDYDGTTLKGYTVEVGALDDSGNYAGSASLDGYMTYLYKPEIAAEYSGTYDANGRSPEMFKASDGGLYYAYEDGHVETKLTWCVLDMLGDPMAITSLDLKDLLGSMGGTVINLLPSMANGIGTLLNENLTNVVVYATNGQRLYIHLYLDDEGLLNITLIPAAIENGYMGYQWMTWMQSGNLLVTVCGVMSIRNLLYIFGAVSLVLIFAIGVINESIEKKKKAAKSDGESEDEKVEADLTAEAPPVA